MAKPRSNLYKQVQVPVSDITWAMLQRYAREHNISVEEAGRLVVRHAIKVINKEKKMKPETTEQFEKIAQEAIESAELITCESVEEFRLGLLIIVSMIRDRIKELEGC